MARRKAFVLFELMNAMLYPAQAAKARGFDIVALNSTPLCATGPFTVPDGLVDEQIKIVSWADGTALELVLKDLAERYEVVGTHSMFEATLPHQAALRELVGLPTTGVEDLTRILDKAQVRAELQDAGLTALRTAPLDEALEWREWGFAGAAVLKPANGTGSALCFEVASPDELRDAVATVREADVVNPMMRDYILAHGGFVLEEKAEGELLSVESLVHRGEVGFVTLTGRYVLASDPVVEQGMQTPYHHPLLPRIVAASEAVHACLGFHHGGTHLEFMVADDGTVELIDFNPRPGGFASPVSIGEVYGIDYAEVLVDIGCGIEPDLGFTRRPPRYAVEMVVLPRPGTTEFRTIEFPEDSIVGRATKSPGDRLTGRADQLDAVGMFIVTGDTAEQAHRRGLEARREVVVNGEPLGDNPNNVVAHSPYIGRNLPVPLPTVGEKEPETRESAVRSYSRSFPTTFESAHKEFLVGADGTRYLDFLAGAGAMNYGHNPEFAKRALIDYIERGGVAHALDLSTTAKSDFLAAFGALVLEPRGLDHKVQFCSPSGTNAVEAALKIARLVTGRTNVVAFGGAFHGMSTGALGAMGSGFYKQGLRHTLPQTTHIPFPDSPMGPFDSIDLLDRTVRDASSGTEKPAAVIVETVQCEGGVYVAPPEFLVALRRWCDTHEVLLIVDDIQVGCGRTGAFFSFEEAGIEPDLITLSKAISGFGLPMALLLLKPEYDVWKPGQHSGTFRGNQLAFVAAAETLRTYWSDGPAPAFGSEVVRKGELVAAFLERHITGEFGVRARGRGLIRGIDLGGSGISAEEVSRRCFARGLIVETCGREGEVLKILPPLTIEDSNLLRGLEIIAGALADVPRATTDPARTAGASSASSTASAS
ncbi:diaminobutyrate--2-oxoglutarate transaminase [Streptomyces niveus]|uniref:diaminobutyrate--2-oxoglutarate transaminase n=1 Tax=Streptomyces niveus TaxID=193462 RepID=UPI0035D66749